jgi:4-hydroxy-3-methylbut-2-enyl diphosphate reductase
VVVVRDLEEAETLAAFVRGDRDVGDFETLFGDRISEGFDPAHDLARIGVVNQTTMLATETAAIAALMRQAMVDRYGADSIDDHFADTTDTLCYATKENQDATIALIDDGADIALVVGGYNSSNTSHLVELCEEAMPTYFIADAGEILGEGEIQHFDWRAKQVRTTSPWLPSHSPVDVLLTAGASCPDAMLDAVIHRMLSFFPAAKSVDEALEHFVASATAA